MKKAAVKIQAVFKGFKVRLVYHIFFIFRLIASILGFSLVEEKNRQIATIDNVMLWFGGKFENFQKRKGRERALSQHEQQ